MHSDDGLSWKSPLYILAAQLAKLGIMLNAFEDFDGAILMADVTAGLVDIRNGIGRAAWHEATDVFGWLISLGFAGVSICATPKVSMGVSALCLLVFIGNIVW